MTAEEQEEQNELSVYVAEWRALSKLAALMSEALPLYQTVAMAVKVMKHRAITCLERKAYSQAHDALSSALNEMIVCSRRLDEVQTMSPDDLSVQIALFISEASKVCAAFAKRLARRPGTNRQDRA
jgi:hypothetical protein